jgi:hypothetical protein
LSVPAVIDSPAAGIAQEVGSGEPKQIDG